MKWNKSKKEIKLHKKLFDNSIWIVMTLFNKYFFKSFFGPFFVFGFPIMLLGILGTLMNPGTITVGILAMSGASLSLMTLPVSMLSLKESVLLKRIGASTVSEKEFTFAIMLYFILIGILSFCWIVLWALIFFHSKTAFTFDNVEWGGLLLGYILNISLGLSLGMVISGRTKSQQQAQAIGMLIYFPSTFLGGMFLPMNLIAQNKVMNDISYIIPFRYTTGLMLTSWVAGDPSLPAQHAKSIFDIGKGISVYIHGNGKESVHIYGRVVMILNLTIPVVLISLSTGFAIKFFSWSRR